MIQLIGTPFHIPTDIFKKSPMLFVESGEDTKPLAAQ